MKAFTFIEHWENEEQLLFSHVFWFTVPALLALAMMIFLGCGSSFMVWTYLGISTAVFLRQLFWQEATNFGAPFAPFNVSLLTNILANVLTVVLLDLQGQGPYIRELRASAIILGVMVIWSVLRQEKFTAKRAFGLLASQLILLTGSLYGLVYFYTANNR